VRFQHVNGRTGRYRYPEILGAGVALLDYDTDGDLDLYLVNGNRLEGAPDPTVKSALYRNDGRGRFTDVSEAAGVAAVGYGQGACAGDADGDGDVDLYVTFFGPNRFFRNRGDGTFAAAEKAAGLEDESWGQSCAFLDYDGDGHLDLYVLNYLTYSLEMPQDRFISLGGKQVQDYLGPQPFAGAVSRLFRNRGGGTFVDVTKAAGLHRNDGKGMGLAAVDFDGDDRTDIFQANDGVPDFLFRNRGGGTLDEIGLMAGVAVGGDGQPKSSMGVDAGDVDNDGDLDIVTPVVRNEVYSLFRNDGAAFADASWESGLAEATGRLTGFSPHLADFDSDGDLDLFVTNGEVQTRETVGPEADDLARFGTPAIVLAGDGKGRFTDASKGAGPYFERALIGRGAAAGDIDNDGDVDLVVSHCGGPAVVLRNDAPAAGWITLVLRQHGGNREAIGAKVWLEAGGKKQYREVSGGGGYLSTNDRRLHFGLGSAAQVDRLEIRWPDGARETRTALPASRIVVIERGK
jgi:enediyne biosynthesis protein E4